MDIEEEGKTYIKIKDRQEKSIIERNKVLEKLSKLEPLENEDLKTAGKTYDELNDMVVRLRTDNFFLQQENKQLKDGLHKILDLNKRAINCDSQKVTIKYLLKQYDLIYETLGELQPGLMKGNKE